MSEASGDSTPPQVHPTAVIDEGARLAARVVVWHFCHVMPEAELGEACTLGQNVFVGRGVRIGAGTKIQNNVSVYSGVEIGERCFIGPSVVFTNVKTPRAEVKRRHLYEPTRIGDGASLGANATIVCGVTIGRYAMVGAGAVVTQDVRDNQLVVGVPARVAGWVCRCGAVLPGGLVCPECGRRYESGAKGIAEIIP